MYIYYILCIHIYIYYNTIVYTCILYLCLCCDAVEPA